MLKRFLAAFRDLRKRMLAMQEAQAKVAAAEVPRLRAAVAYNTKNVPIFAPDGFPSFVKSYIRSHESSSDSFAKAVAVVQKELGIQADGFCGPSTINSIASRDRQEKGPRSVIIGPRAYPIGTEVVTYLDAKEWAGLPSRSRSEDIRQVVLHYDVTFDSHSTLNVLRMRKLSYHFLIDGDRDATIYQTHNPTTNVCFHAGPANNHSVGVCLNNPADPKYQARDTRQRGRQRPVRHDNVHGGSVELLDFFEEQLEVVNQLVPILCKALGVPNQIPRREDGQPKKGVLKDPASFSGVLGHYHLTTSKIDPAPLDWEDLTL